MSCPEELALMAFMDGELDSGEADRIRAHIQGCGPCRAFVESQSLMEKSWRDSWNDPPGFRFSAMRKALGKPRRRPIPGWVVGIAAGAAAVFLGVRALPSDRQENLEQLLRRETGVCGAGTASDRLSRHDEEVKDVPGECEAAQTESALLPSVMEEETVVEDGVTPSPSVAPEEHPSGSDSRSSDESPDVSLLLAGASAASPPTDSMADEAFYGETRGIAAESPAPAGEAVSSLEAVSAHQRQIHLDSAQAYLECMESPAPVFSLVCRRPDGSEIPPWHQLRVFVDSLLSTGFILPESFRLDSLGYTVEDGDFPRVFLGVADSSIVPLTVRVLTD